MPRVDLTNYLDDDAVEVPGIPSTAFPEGRSYRFASPDAATGLRLAHLADLAVQARLGVNIGAQAAALSFDDAEERDLMRDVMGATLDELTADGVSWTRIQRLNRWLFIYFAMGEDVAAGLQLQGGATAQPNRATRRAASKSPTPEKSATPQASHGGSTSRKRAAKAKA